MRRTGITAILLFALFISTAAWAAVPQTLHYSGRLDTAGGAFTGTVDVGFALYANANAATSFWSETQAVAVTNGRFHVELGPLSAADVDVAALQLGVTVGSDDEMALVAISSVPYALRATEAGNAATVGGESASAFADSAHTHALADLDIADGLDFSEFKDTLTLDASTTVQIPASVSLTMRANSQDSAVFYGNGDVMLGLSGATGNVSVGATPTSVYKFSVNGATRLLGNAYFSGNVGVGAAASADYKLYVGSSKAIHSTGTSYLEGNVGIGVTPGSSYPLTVDGDVLMYGGSVGIGGTPSSLYQLRVVGDATVTGTLDAAAFVGDGTALTGVLHTEDDPEVGTNATGYVPKWDGTALSQGSIFDNGKVGIGTADPQKGLHVSSSPIQIDNTPGSHPVLTGTNWQEVLRFGNTGGLEHLYFEDGGAAQLSFHTGRWGHNLHITRNSSAGAKQIASVFGSDLSHRLDVYDVDGSTVTLSLAASGDSYFNGGKLGIGTTTPGYRLAVNTGSSGGDGIQLTSQTYDAQGGNPFSHYLLFSDKNSDNGSIQFRHDGTASYFRFTVGGINAAETVMTLQEDGNVGIGTNTPDYQMHVAGAGDVLVEDTAAGSAHVRLRSSTDGVITSDWKIKTNAANEFYIDQHAYDEQNNLSKETVLVIDSDRNVGIGANGGTRGRLLVSDDTVSYNAISEGHGTLTLQTTKARTAGEGPHISFVVPKGAAGVVEDMAYIAAVASDSTVNSRKADLTFWTRNQEIGEKMRLTSDGKVGIGTVSPQSVLDLGNGTSGDGLVWGGTTGANHYASVFTTYSSGSLTMAFGYKGLYGVNGWAYSYEDQSRSAISLYSGSIRFFSDPVSTQTVGDVASPTERMRITDAGYVGVGTTTPKGLLHIVNTTPYDAEETYTGQDSIVLSGGISNATDGYYGGITWGHGARRRAGIASVMEATDSDHVGLAFFTRGTDGPGPMYETMRIAHNGYVGIGTSSPNTQLEVNGTVTANSIKFADGSTQTTAASTGSSGPGSVFYIYYNHTCPLGWTQFHNGHPTAGSSSSDVCYRTDKQCLIFYIYYDHTCPSGFTQFQNGHPSFGASSSDICYKCD